MKGVRQGLCSASTKCAHHQCRRTPTIGMMDSKTISLRVTLKQGKGFPRPAAHQRVYAQATVNGEVSGADYSGRYDLVDGFIAPE